jgi:hypothetical protein
MEGSKLSGQWKVLNLVALGMFHVWWPMEGSNAWWPLGRRKKNIIFTFFHFHPQQILFKFFFIDFKVLLYHGFRPLLYIFPSFSLTYKFQPRILMYQIFHTFIAKLILIKDFFFPSIHGVTHDHVLRASSRTNE